MIGPQYLNGHDFTVEVHHDGTSLVRSKERGVPFKEVNTAITRAFLEEMATSVDRFAQEAPPAAWSRAGCSGQSQTLSNREGES